MTKEKESPAPDAGANQDLEPLQEALENLPQEQKEVILERLFYSGPVMPPGMLGEVGSTIPGERTGYCRSPKRSKLTGTRYKWLRWKLTTGRQGFRSWAGCGPSRCSFSGSSTVRQTGMSTKRRRT